MIDDNRGGTFPSDARRVFKGKIYEVLQWEQKLYDGSTATFEEVSRPDTVEVIAVADGKIMVEEQEQPGMKDSFFSLPGGRADGGATPLDEIRREFLEETGYSSDDWELWQRVHPFLRHPYTIHYFIARGCTQTQTPHLDAGEKITLRFVTFEELLAFSDNPGFRSTDFVKQLLRLRLDEGMREEFRKKLLM
jgi:8-oxo-dGTP pyrophosphatase MutT (NUDIX family)